PVPRAAAGPPRVPSVSVRSATSRGYRCLQRLRGRGVPSQEIRRAHWLLAGRLDHLQPKRPVRGTEQQSPHGRPDLPLRRASQHGPGGAHAEAIAVLELEVGAYVRRQGPNDPLELRGSERGLEMTLLRGDLPRVTR